MRNTLSKHWKRASLGGLMVGLVAVATGCGQPAQHSSNSTGAASTTAARPVPLSVLYAGSMTHVMEDVIRPNVDRALNVNFQGEGAGSAELAHMITSKLANPDVFISASPSVDVNDLMGPSNGNAARWYATLATDELVIAYSPKSKEVKEFQQAAQGKIPWYQVLEMPGVRFGRTDPKLDPKGVNTILMMKLAEAYYHQPDLEKRILGSDENPAQVFPEEDLIAQLTSGQMDAVIAYKHEAIEWHVPYITLPAAINLGDPALAKDYAKVSWTPSGGGKTIKGAPILFTITVLTHAPHPQQAAAFVRYMTVGEGHQILMRDGFTPTPIKFYGDVQSVPASLRSIAVR
ncbi:extracellular solute-binding protein [Alicyclobacillus vulcanalis]|uniref:Molybdate/tungstate transport system substrate-binding protein n=1 Tax=Alicyclobacillus vulcanalis TaxID=252246 RepID=A0A1N7KA27_9BACL|nr:extracellular solute-binding protein [Alicyclobacillus vulcanalis]SIS58445.1 molybdate/tungstate transport system substrate-binding protein [Alicyclobacillus vulcanalis]